MERSEAATMEKKRNVRLYIHPIRLSEKIYANNRQASFNYTI